MDLRHPAPPGMRPNQGQQTVTRSSQSAGKQMTDETQMLDTVALTAVQNMTEDELCTPRSAAVYEHTECVPSKLNEHLVKHINDNCQLLMIRGHSKMLDDCMVAQKGLPKIGTEEGYCIADGKVGTALYSNVKFLRSINAFQVNGSEQHVLEQLANIRETELETSNTVVISSENVERMTEGKSDASAEFATRRTAVENASLNSEEVDMQMVETRHETVERQELIYKLAQFVKQNALLHDDLEATTAKIKQLEKLLETERQNVEKLQQENVHLRVKLAQPSGNVELTRRDQELCPGDLKLPCSDRAEPVGASHADVINSDEMSSGVREELEQAVQQALNQQEQLCELRRIIKSQSICIEKLCHRVSVLGLEIRTHAGHDGVITSKYTDGAFQQAAGGLQQDIPRRRQVDVADIPVSYCANDMENETVQQLAGQNVTNFSQAGTQNAVSASPHEVILELGVRNGQQLASLPPGFEMTSNCPICQVPIPFDPSSQEVFSLHVDECIKRVTREGPPGQDLPQTNDRTCPVCQQVFPQDRYMQAEFERHVNEHFEQEPVHEQFVVLE